MSVEDMGDAREVELHSLRKEVIALQDQHVDLQYDLQDLENRSRRYSITLKGVPLNVGSGDLEGYASRIFRHILPALEAKDITLDCTHRARRRHGPSQRLQDILTCVHQFRQKEDFMRAARARGLFKFEGASINLYQDLSLQTLQRRHRFRPIIDFLRRKDIKYRWGHPFRLIFMWDKEEHIIRTLAEGQTALGLPHTEEESAERSPT